MFCEIVLCFFCVCAGLMSLLGVEKERPYLHCFFVLIFIQKSRPHGPQNGRKVVLCQVAVPIKSS